MLLFVGNDDQRDHHATKINKVAASDTTVSFYLWIYNIYTWISIYGPPPYLTSAFLMSKIRLKPVTRNENRSPYND